MAQMIKMFVGLTFSSESDGRYRIESFKKRFDEKFVGQEELFLSLFPPFEVAREHKRHFINELSECIDNFFLEEEGTTETAPRLRFKGLDVFRSGKNHTLYLDPEWSDDLAYLMESIEEVIKDNKIKESTHKTKRKTFLPLATFAVEGDLKEAIDIAGREMDEQIDMQVSGISIFEKNAGGWLPVLGLKLFQTPASIGQGGRYNPTRF